MALENYVADKHMKSNILNPSIVLIEGDLQFDTYRRNCIDIASILKQDRTFLKTVEKYILASRPDILVFEGSVSRKIVERIRDIG
mmetsp:Transcript_15939/g.13918  ORF Transcript_15939/g.13918 Transcript_15939/m.13918 type:complete len:85 (+) Transcript_15939:360-614(+)